MNDLVLLYLCTGLSLMAIELGTLLYALSSRNPRVRQARADVGKAMGDLGLSAGLTALAVAVVVVFMCFIYAVFWPYRLWRMLRKK